MHVSEARIEANRRNAQKSTGPKTEEGKKISRANALTHGLCSATVVPEDAKTVLGRGKEFFNTLKPQNHFHGWLVGAIALLTFKIDRAERMDRRVRDKIAIKAELCWDDDKRIEAELLGEQLANRPAVVIEQLRKTPQGCEWLMARWAMLAYVADTKDGKWTPEQEQLAFDLLATPKDFREGHKPGVSLDFRGKIVDAGTNLAEVARREIDALEERREVVRALDEINQSLAQADLYDDTDAELRRLRKYEGSLHSRLRWCVRQLQVDAPVRELPRWVHNFWFGYQETMADYPAPAWKQPPFAEPTPVQEPPGDWVAENLAKQIHPPFDLEPDEFPPPGQKANIPAIEESRRQKKLKKAEERRDARRRKAEKLLG
jgi:hypothetical protein